jgi:hypothetical protein
VLIALAVGLEPTALAGPLAGPPPTPTAVTLTPGSKSLKAAWSAPDNTDVSFKATAKTASSSHSCTTDDQEDGNAQGGRWSCQIRGLSNGVVYVVSVVASNESGASSPSTPATTRTGVPSNPRFPAATPGIAGVSVSWAVPTVSGASKITSYMATAEPGGFSCSTYATILSRPGRRCEITGLTPGTTYVITVTATNSFGTGAPSGSVSTTPKA